MLFGERIQLRPVSTMARLGVSISSLPQSPDRVGALIVGKQEQDVRLWPAGLCARAGLVGPRPRAGQERQTGGERRGGPGGDRKPAHHDSSRAASAAAAIRAMASSFSTTSGSISSSGTNSASRWKFVFAIRFGWPSLPA